MAKIEPYEKGFLFSRLFSVTFSKVFNRRWPLLEFKNGPASI
jgi:hypothetical protein